MASPEEYIDFVCGQLQGVGLVMPKMMFGDWCVYIDGKPVILVCDSICYVKIHPAIEALMEGAETGYPYPGAKLHYILDIEHRAEAARVARILTEVLPLPKKKNKKS